MTFFFLDKPGMTLAVTYRLRGGGGVVISNCSGVPMCTLRQA